VIFSLLFLLFSSSILSFPEEIPNPEGTTDTSADTDTAINTDTAVDTNTTVNTDSTAEIKEAVPLSSLIIKVARKAQVYIDGIFYQNIPQGSVQIDRIESGKHRIQVIYTDDYTEIRLIELQAGMIKQIDFTRPPTADQQQAKRLGYKRKKNYLSASAGLNAIVPVSDTARIMNPGCSPADYINYNLTFTTMIMSLGAFSGISLESAKNLSEEDYYLYSMPIGFNIAFRSNMNRPLMVAIEANSGAALSLVMFKDKTKSEYNKLVTKYFMMPALGIGYNFNTDFGLFFYGSFLLTFFDNSIFQGVSAGIRCDFSL
jgi:hypothetical protein